MKIKRISGILIGTSAILVSAVTLTSCGGESISFKSYKTESTKEEFEKAYDSFIEEKKTTGYDLTVGNTAEISEDKNEYDSPDIDSTPGNEVPGEDDIDIAKVILSIKTGKENIAPILIGTAIILSTLAGGILLIKKFVI